MSWPATLDIMPEKYELESDFTQRVKIEAKLSIFESRDYARYIFLLKEVDKAEDINDIKNILKRIISCK